MQANQTSIVIRPIRAEGQTQLIELSHSYSETVVAFSGDIKLKDLLNALQEYYPACEADGEIHLILSFEVKED